MIWLAVFVTVVVLIGIWQFMLCDWLYLGRLVRGLLVAACCCRDPNCKAGCRAGCKTARALGAK